MVLWKSSYHAAVFAVVAVDLVVDVAAVAAVVAGMRVGVVKGGAALMNSTRRERPTLVVAVPEAIEAAPSASFVY